MFSRTTALKYLRALIPCLSHLFSRGVVVCNLSIVTNLNFMESAFDLSRFTR
jgi:hypothetical protein